jgi:hypothetical protein
MGAQLVRQPKKDFTTEATEITEERCRKRLSVNQQGAATL